MQGVGCIDLFAVRVLKLSQSRGLSFEHRENKAFDDHDFLLDLRSG